MASGPSIDSKGGAVVQPVDPTANVLLLVEAANKRQDDLRNAETRRVDEQMKLRADHAGELREAEAKRIDAIRAVDVNAVAVASAKAADQATVLATQVVSSAEALRTLVASTAATIATSQSQLVAALSARLTTLEQGSYQAVGRSTVADPAMAQMVEEIKKLSLLQATGTGKSAGISGLWAIILGAGSLLMTLISIGTFVLVTLRK